MYDKPNTCESKLHNYTLETEHTLTLKIMSAKKNEKL